MRQLRSLALATVLASAACSDGNGPGEDAVFTSVSVGRTFACTLTEVATAYCWGARLGDQLTLDSEPRAYGGGQRFRQLSVAQGLFGSYVCGLAEAGTLCQGGLLVGFDSFEPFSEELAPLEHEVALDTMVTASTHFCGLTEAGTAWCWGDLNLGMRGTGEPEGRNWNLEPNTVAGGLSFRTIGAGLSHSCGHDRGRRGLLLGRGGAIGGSLRHPRSEWRQLRVGSRHRCAMCPCAGAHRPGRGGEGPVRRCDHDLRAHARRPTLVLGSAAR